MKRRESVALQTFLTADATAFTFASVSTGRSCITAETSASGASRKNMSLASSREGYNRVRNWICVICNRTC